jgi:integrase/recombinase XerD
MVIILREYMRIRKGGPDDYLFPNDRGEALTENGLRCTIAKYNRRRGVQKTSLHMFRHTFARKYLVDCGGNAFTLQALLGHSTLDMTKKYCAIYNADLSKNFDNLSPLSKLTSRKKKLTVR